MVALNAPPASPNVAPPNTQSPQILSSPNSRSLQQLQQWARMGMRQPGGLATSGLPGSWPTAGFASAMPALSQNPLQQGNQQAMIAALQGQR